MPATTINDALNDYLAIAGFTTGSLNDRFYRYLGTLGHTGSYNDRVKSWLGGSGSINDRWTSFLSGYTGAFNDRQFSYFLETSTNPTWAFLSAQTWDDLTDNTWGQL